MTPDGLDKLHGDDNTAMERVIICYYKDEEEKLAALLGLEKIEKVVYNYKELEK